MKKIVVIPLLICFYIQLSGQVKHELKMPFFNIFIKDLQPSYEIITKNERIGLEIGGGFDFGKARLNSITDTSFTGFNFEYDEYKQRVFKSALALKFYFSATSSNVRVGLFFGPFVEYDKTTFYEEAFFVRQEEIIIDKPTYNRKYIGQREIRPGIKGGLKVVHKSNFVLEISGRLGWYFDENVPGEIKYKPRNNFLWPAVRVGYRFKEKPDKKVVEY